MIPSVDLWLAFMPHVVTLYPYTGNDAYGEATYGTGVTYPAHVEPAVENVSVPNGEIVTSRLKVIVGAAVKVDPRDRFVVPGLFGHRSTSGTWPATEDAEIVSVEHIADERGHHHTEVRTK